MLDLYRRVCHRARLWCCFVSFRNQCDDRFNKNKAASPRDHPDERSDSTLSSYRIFFNPHREPALKDFNRRIHGIGHVNVYGISASTLRSCTGPPARVS